MMFGLMSAPYEFRRVMNKVLGDLRNTVASTYFDDIINAVKDCDDLLDRLEKVLKTRVKAGPTLNQSKCLFEAQEFHYLGFRISAEGIRLGLQKLNAITDFPEPENVHGVRRFMGFTGHF